ncbi:alginate lyase family protein [Namhaeicola litoreus]|uniref:Alginate lyase family protein n=1 Tax=Namhaeicola litoreus TaxID=1052145 RepID=A0ABW3Y6K0_9FLAO
MKKNLLYVLICFFFLSRLTSQELTNLDFELVESAQKKIADKDTLYLLAIEKLIRNADKALYEGPFTVMSKTQVPPSGNKHDYLSLAPYFWPDPDQPNGLPWMRKDGQVNPGTRGDNVDYEEKNNFFRNVKILSWAFYFSNNKKYAEKAKELLEVWFINPETKMNPNLNYAQGIPGQNDGRCFGIIEFGGISEIITAIELLELKNALDAKTSKELRSWLSEYLNWLQTSEFGIQEKTRSNNHATHYDGQVVSLLLFLNRNEEAREVLVSVKTNRIATQIEPDGSQPHELGRTNALSYSTMNLKGLTKLAYFGKRNNIDIWNYKAENGASIQKAYAFLAPYALGEKEWDYEQIKDLEGSLENLKKLFRNAANIFGINEVIDPKIYNELNNPIMSFL